MGKIAATRRQFLAGSLTGVSSVWLGTHWPAIMAAHEHAQATADSGQLAKFEFFSPEQAAEIEAMAAQTIPTDDTPGAREARVIYFIDRALTTFDRDQQALYVQGLKDLLAKTRELFPNSAKFSDLATPQQIQVLTAMEETHFFSYVRLHTIMGFLANPEYGGNHNKIGWKLIGFTDEHSFQPPFGFYDQESEKNRQ